MIGAMQPMPVGTARLRRNVICGALGTIVAVMLGFFLVDLQFRHLSIDRAKQRVDAVGAAVTATLNRTLLQVDATITAEIRRLHQMQPHSYVENRILWAYGAEDSNIYRDLLIVDAEGQVLASMQHRTRTWSLPRTIVDALGRGAVGHAALVGPSFEVRTGEWLVYIARPIDRERWLLAEVPISALSDSIAPIVSRQYVVATIASGNGVVLATYPHDDAAIGKPSPAFTGNAIPLVYPLLHGGAKVTLAIDSEAIDALMARDRDAAMFAATAIIIVVLAGAFLLLRSIAQRETIAADRLRSRQQLEAAIEAFPGGFILWDANECLVMCNQRYREMYALMSPVLVPGARFTDVQRYGARVGQFGPIDDFDRYISDIYAEWRRDKSTIECRLADGKIIRAQGRTIAGGGRVGVSIDVTEERNHIETVTKYNLALERFSYIASHDLQEPLRKIGTYTEILRQAVAENDASEIENCLRVLSGAATRGRDLVRSLLDFSRLRERDLVREAVDLKVIVDEVVSRYADDVTAGRAQFRITGEPLQVYGDATLIGQVLANLVGNAVKYRPTGAMAHVLIEMTIDQPAGLGRIIVSDQGIGFDMAHAERLFEPFRRLVSRHEYSGTGIGLSIVKSILDKHGWEIAVDSAPGQGARFAITIPSRDCEPAKHSSAIAA